MSAKIVVVGSLNMDLVARAARIPKPGETVQGGEDLKTIPGGKGGNQAASAARLGASVAMIGRIGSDAFGVQLVNSLRAMGIDISCVYETPYTSSGVAVIIVDPQGENSIVIASGSNGKLLPSDLDRAKETLTQAEILLLQLEVPLDTVVAAAKMAKEHGVKVVLNPAPAQVLPKELLDCVDVLVLNETEAELLVGQGTAVTQENAAEQLKTLEIPNVILTLGAEGAVLLQGETAVHVPPFPITPVDTTASGDSFIGSFACALTEGHSWEEAVRRGNAAGALTVTKLGAQASLPTRQELDAFVA